MRDAKTAGPLEQSKRLHNRTRSLRRNELAAAIYERGDGEPIRCGTASCIGVLHFAPLKNGRQMWPRGATGQTENADAVRQEGRSADEFQASSLVEPR